jgi:ubiquinone biosynthesis protein
VTAVRLVLRLGSVGAVLLAAAARAGWLALPVLFGRNRARVVDRLAALCTDTLERLGPTFVKAGQLLSTRADLLPPDVRRHLGRLHDRVKPPPARALPPMAGLREVLTRPVGSGSIACVYRGRLHDGRTVAVKVRRPDVVERMRADLALITAGARLAARLPGLRRVPVNEMVAQVGACILGQLDLAGEARSLARMRVALADIPDVVVPAVHAELCAEDVIVMDFVDGLDGPPAWQLPAAVRRRTVARALHAAYQMLFVDGLVHCDLHPGNLFLLDDGRVVIVDAGFTHQLAPGVRHAFAEFFFNMGAGRPDRCADVVLGTIRAADPDADVAAFRRELVALVAVNTSVCAGDFNLRRFATGLFNLQRLHGLYAAPEFVFPLLALLVIEGMVDEVDRTADFQGEAVPYLMRALLEGD